MQKFWYFISGALSTTAHSKCFDEFILMFLDRLLNYAKISTLQPKYMQTTYQSLSFYNEKC